MPAKPSYIATPQRLDGAAWVTCPEHMAKRWAVQSIACQGKITVRRTVISYKRKAQAQAAALSLNNAARAKPSPSLGSRMTTAGKALYRSLTKAEWLQIKGLDK